MNYDIVLFDLDHTLLDSDASETQAFEEMLKRYGVQSSAELLGEYRSINRRLWAEVEQGHLSPDVVRIERFTEFGKLHIPGADPIEMAERFADGLKTNGTLYPGVPDVLDRLFERASLALVTNGLGDIQRARIERLGVEAYFEAVVISAEVGVAKPDPRVFEIAFRLLGDPSRKGALMVGDSLTSDMAGAAAFGIDSCWYNPNGRPKPSWPPITHQIRSLTELPSLLDSESA